MNTPSVPPLEQPYILLTTVPNGKVACGLDRILCKMCEVSFNSEENKAGVPFRLNTKFPLAFSSGANA